MSIRALCPGALAAAFGCALLLAGCSARDAGHGAVAGQVHATAAQRIVLDPTTLLPTAAEPASNVRPAPATAASVIAVWRTLPAVPEEVRLPDGTVGVKVAQQYAHLIVICRQRDGRFSTQCPAAQAKP